MLADFLFLSCGMLNNSKGKACSLGAHAKPPNLRDEQPKDLMKRNK